MAQPTASQAYSSAYQPKETKTQYQARYRHFHPQDVVTVRNPFDEELVWTVADDSGQQLEYILAANSVGELPGGLVATIGVRTIVDQLIQEASETDPGLYLNLYNPDIRAKYEEQIIMKFKPAPVTQAPQQPGDQVRVNLTTKDMSMAPKDTPVPEDKRVNVPKPSLSVKSAPPPDDAFPDVPNFGKEAADAAKAHMGTKAQVIDE
jgi:hypothetical protein